VAVISVVCEPSRAVTLPKEHSGDAASNAIGYAKFYSRSYNAVIRVYDEAGNVIETHEHEGDLTATCLS
jgi:hypothetical protein